MKIAKKVLSLLTSLFMVLGLSITAFADGDVPEETVPTYSITINNAVVGESYTAYKIFNASPATDDSGDIISVSYTISNSDQWYTLLTDYKQYVSEDDTDGYNPFVFTASAADSTEMVVTVAENKTVDAANLAKYLNDNKSGKTSAAPSVNADDTTVEIVVSGPGYYFVDTNLGSLCSLDTVAGTNQVIYEKNSKPSITKYVLEDDNNTDHTAISGDTAWKNYENNNAGTYVNNETGKKAILDANESAKFRLVINTGSNDNNGADNNGVDGDYTIVDKLPVGFKLTGTTTTVDGESVTTYPVHIKTAEDTDNWDDSDYTIEYSEITANPGQFQLKITLKSSKLAQLGENKNIDITYTAEANTVDTTSGAQLNNTVPAPATLAYKTQSTSSSALVTTYQLVTDAEGNTPNFQKVEKVNGNNVALPGVKFTLSRVINVNGTDTTQYAAGTSRTEAGKETKMYDFTGWSTTVTKFETNDNGTFNVIGLDAGTYTLTETDTLPGYNLLTEKINVVISEDGTVTYKYENATGNGSESITVENNKGTELPSTGGMGTTLFYTVGSILVVGAAVLLITKKRMSGAAE